MAVNALKKGYQGEIRDKVENFNGNQLVYVGWDKHLLFCSAFTFMVSAESTFRALTDEVIVDAFSQHPEWSQINWGEANWLLNGESFVPDRTKTLKEQGITHKSLLRFETPQLKGFMDAAV